MLHQAPRSTLFPYTTLFRSGVSQSATLERVLPGTATASQSTVARTTVRNDDGQWRPGAAVRARIVVAMQPRSEEHTSELQSRENLVCRLLLEKKNKLIIKIS